MTFIELYQQAVHAPTPRQVFIDRLAKATGASPETVQHWCKGDRRPSTKKKEVIAQLFGSDSATLFPKK